MNFYSGSVALLWTTALPRPRAADCERFPDVCAVHEGRCVNSLLPAAPGKPCRAAAHPNAVP